MNFIVNQMDHLNISEISYELIPEDMKIEKNLDGRLVGVNGDFLISGKNVVDILKFPRYGLRDYLGRFAFQALFRKPMMIFLIPSGEEDFAMNECELKKRYGLMAIRMNNFAQCFSLACWFVKDSCVAATNIYGLNPLNGYVSQSRRELDVTLSDGTIRDVCFEPEEVQEAIVRMYEIYRYLLPKESKTAPVEYTSSLGTEVWEIDKSISSEGNSFAKALILLQYARKTGVLSSKIEHYCAILECLYALNKNHKKNIAEITAALISTEDTEREEVRENMKILYGIRSDSSHGDSLKFLKENPDSALSEYARKLDEYVRRVFRVVISESGLNYEPESDRKIQVRAFFEKKSKEFYR